MKSRSIFVAAIFLVVMLHAAAARSARKAEDVAPPSPERILDNTATQSNKVLADLVTTMPGIPLGPLDVLKEYEKDMTLVAQRMSADVANISQAQEGNQITREQAEYLIQQRYEVAMMQFQILSALHDALGHDVAQAAGQAKRRESDTAVVVQLPSSEPSGAGK